ncbi:hypothetical protein WME97_28295 [Sorangium sp. So ce367]|uniref:hypothetical protein n=1 Tax=Sorangium sp. So ce367 TaxID=3133305 RepID=UPI003F6042DE
MPDAAKSSADAVAAKLWRLLHVVVQYLPPAMSARPFGRSVDERQLLSIRIEGSDDPVRPS